MSDHALPESTLCQRTEELLASRRSDGLAEDERRHLRECAACGEALFAEELLMADAPAAASEARRRLPTARETLQAFERIERRRRERQAFLVMRAVEAGALVSAVGAAAATLRWVSPELRQRLVELLETGVAQRPAAEWTLVLIGAWLLLFALGLLRSSWLED